MRSFILNLSLDMLRSKNKMSSVLWSNSLRRQASCYLDFLDYVSVMHRSKGKRKLRLVVVLTQIGAIFKYPHR